MQDKKKIGFDEIKYVNLQTQKIRERVGAFSKLYIEFGGKLFDDYHAARVLPGFQPDTKIKVFNKLKDDMEIIFCVSAEDIENNRIRGDSGLTYDLETLRCLAELRKNGFTINNVVITLFNGQQRAAQFAEFLQNVHGENVTLFPYLEKYMSGNVDEIVSDECLGMCPYIETTKDIVLINAPGARSGKLCIALSQMYHSRKIGKPAGYAKFETFPVFNLPANHLVNLAFKTATADFDDKIMVDEYYQQKYGITATSYNRDMDLFPVVARLTNYSSPTEMGVSSVGESIVDEAVVNEAAKNEIIRRYFRYESEFLRGLTSFEVVERAFDILTMAGIDLPDNFEECEEFVIHETAQSTKETLDAYGDLLKEIYK